MSSSTCFVIKCKIGFALRWTTLRLSHQSIGDFGRWIFNSLKREASHTSFVVAFARQQNYALMLDLDIVCCFFDPQVIKLPPNTHIPEVERLSSGSNT